MVVTDMADRRNYRWLACELNRSKTIRLTPAARLFHPFYAARRCGTNRGSTGVVIGTEAGAFEDAAFWAARLLSQRFR